MSSILTKIIVEETSGVDRITEPVTVGIPFPRGMLKDQSVLGLIDQEVGEIPIQTKTLANWPDSSLKWVLFDFQVSVKANTKKELEIVRHETTQTGETTPDISIDKTTDHLIINTGQTTFYMNVRTFKPFHRVTSHEIEVLDSKSSSTILTDETGEEYTPLIQKIFIETKGPVRTTIKVGGMLQSPGKKVIADFFARLHFFTGKSSTKIDFTIHNPKAAKHPGGLWDLGDSGSIFFQDLSLYFALKRENDANDIRYQLSAMTSPSSHETSSSDHSPLTAHRSPSLASDSPLTAHSSLPLVVYQDSSGGENWMSHNHMNRNGEVRNTFRGYRVYENGKVIQEGNRITPIMQISDDKKSIAAAIQHFWQNFPKTLEATDSLLTLRLFPKQYDDAFELQGGEQKTHSLFLDFQAGNKREAEPQWVQDPLIPHALPDWYERSGVFPYLIARDKDPNRDLFELINTAVSGDNTFFHRREIIDEYGWRNFGELYADHEAVPQHSSDGSPVTTSPVTTDRSPLTANSLLLTTDSSQPLVSHYNNQYDCIYGMLMQYAGTGNTQWFLLADQLCEHVKDIDIYHTSNDRPEFNRGLFWHTEHYLDAGTATHRCFSRLHENKRDLASYGGGPALSHNYSTGLLYHYYMTGEETSRETVIDLSDFTTNNILMEGTLSNKLLKDLKKIKSTLKTNGSKEQFVDIHKVFELDGPGRASGNALNTLIDAFVLTGDNIYLVHAENLIRKCIGPDDNVDKQDLLDIETRWMYTVFLQALGKYLDIKNDYELLDDMWNYARSSLINYAAWMLKNEHLYLDTPEKLEFPNETWAAQDLRKCNIFFFAAKYSEPVSRQQFHKKARFFHDKGFAMLQGFDTATLTRSLALTLLNSGMHEYFKICDTYSDTLVFQNAMFIKTEKGKDKLVNFSSTQNIFPRVSLWNELLFIKWRLFS